MMKRVKTYSVAVESSVAFRNWLEENGIDDWDVYSCGDYDYFEIEANEKTHEEIGFFLEFELDDYMEISKDFEELMECELC